MAVMSDSWIRTMAEENGMIEPFAPRQVRSECISYGVSSYGYDMRIGREFRVATRRDGAVLDPKVKSNDHFEAVETDVLTLQPGQFALGTSVERFTIPRNILTITYGKSTYARCGVLCNITPFEPEWSGYVTMMVANCGPLPVRIYANEGIAQVIFLDSIEVCEVSYADKAGKYQNQKEITHARL